MSPALARCRAEQARAWRNYLDTGCRGALLGVSDWMLEEIVIMSNTSFLDFGPPKIVCFFSCGAASAVSTWLTLAEYGHERVLILNAFLAAEHEDNRRFLADCERWFGHQIEVVRDEQYGADPFEVFRRVRFIKSEDGAPCAKKLKREVLAKHSFADDIHVLGYTAEEAGRLDKWIDANNGKRYLAPLIDKGLTKSDCLAILDRAGIEMPVMYRMGYNNANCIGCPKGGMGYWNKIRKDFPERFAQMVEIEAMLGPTAYLFRNRKTNERFPLSELDPTAGRHDEPLIECSAACELVDIAPPPKERA